MFRLLICCDKENISGRIWALEHMVHDPKPHIRPCGACEKGDLVESVDRIGQPAN